MTGSAETQAGEERRDDSRRGFVWRCARCGRYIGVLEALDGSLGITHKCRARNRLQAVLLPSAGRASMAGTPLTVADASTKEHTNGRV